MPGRLVEVPLESGRTAYVAADVEGGGDVGAKPASERLRDVIDSVTELTETAVRAVRSSLRQAPPSSIQVQVGIKFAVKSGTLVAFLAEASGEGSLVVTLDWDSADPG